MEDGLEIHTAWRIIHGTFRDWGVSFIAQPQFYSCFGYQYIKHHPDIEFVCLCMVIDEWELRIKVGLFIQFLSLSFSIAKQAYQFI